MIVKPTVFVLGAGASRPYGFPVGSTLAERVCSLMPRGNGSMDDLQGLTWIKSWDLGPLSDFSEQLAIELPRRFKESGCETLDEFVESPGNHRFLPLVKAGMINVLLGHENDTALFPQSALETHQPRATIRTGGTGQWHVFEEVRREYDDWLRYLLRIMRTDRAQTFRQNQVKVVTFNFDRSFERRLYTMLLASYGVSDEEAASLASSVPVLHMHGRLSAEGWLSADGREYGQNADAHHIRSIYSDIRIVHEEIPRERIELVRDWFDEAHTIVMLGFGYHPSNVRRLTLDQGRSQGKNVVGTAYGLTEPEIIRAKSRFGTGVRPTLYIGYSSLRLLREVYAALQTA